MAQVKLTDAEKQAAAQAGLSAMALDGKVSPVVYLAALALIGTSIFISRRISRAA